MEKKQWWIEALGESSVGREGEGRETFGRLREGRGERLQEAKPMDGPVANLWQGGAHGNLRTVGPTRCSPFFLNGGRQGVHPWREWEGFTLDWMHEFLLSCSQQTPLKAIKMIRWKPLKVIRSSCSLFLERNLLTYGRDVALCVPFMLEIEPTQDFKERLSAGGDWGDRL